MVSDGFIWGSYGIESLVAMPARKGNNYTLALHGEVPL